MAADAVAVLDGFEVAAAHVAGASLGGAISQWLAVHRPERVLTLTAIMTGPLGHNAGPAWASPGLPRHIGQLILGHTQSTPPDT